MKLGTILQIMVKKMESDLEFDHPYFEIEYTGLSTLSTWDPNLSTI